MDISACKLLLITVQWKALAADTDPVVSAHWVEAVGTTDEDQVIISGNQHFDEVMALVLKTETKHRTMLRASQLSCSHLTSLSYGGIERKGAR